MYLGSGLIRGIGPRLAERIVARFGIQTFEVIESQPHLLHQVRDIGVKRTRQILEAWEEQKQVKEIVLYLHHHGISTNLAIKIYKEYGNESMEVVQTDPYRLARDIYGIGFKTADRIARALGLPVDHPSRIEAGVVYVLNEMSDSGHVYSPQQALVDRAASLLEVSPDLVQPGVERLAFSDRVRIDFPGGTPEQGHGVREEAAVYLTPFYYGETNVADRLRSLASTRPTRLTSLFGEGSPNEQIAVDSSLSYQQQEAVRTALTNPVSVLTGGPGTGKTTTIKALISILEKQRTHYALASPTGRAAKRLGEATGRQASTIHRLLEFTPVVGFQYNIKNPLPIDLLVVDEVSMLDLLLTNHLLKAIRPGTHILFVGDADQLPSVGAGDVLRDIIDSDLAPVIRLTEIFRQASGSHIITNAHRINRGLAPVFQQDNTDCYLFPAKTGDEAAQWILDLVSERIPRKFGLHGRDQIQVLSPIYRGPAGVDALNTRLQELMNPPSPAKPERPLFGQIFRVGDKVMQTQNNYDKEVFNGDIGWVTALSLEDHTLVVEFDQRKIEYDWTEADELALAYAISIHKAQGSEFTAVVFPVVTQHYLMLQRNLLYTAVTRARQLCVLVGDKRAIHIAVHNNKVAKRYSALDLRLQQR
jgi:exodeoxyribonuclease V alpha subunit